jgi:hypothetical protein
MNRIRVIAVAASLATFFAAATPVIRAQDKSSSHRPAKQAGARAATRTYAPRVIGRSNSMVVTGRITEIQADRISIKSARGARYDFRIDDQTTTLDSGEVVSIATMDDIALSVADLRVADRVEVVTEHAGNSTLARIITLIASSGARIASR